MSTKFKDGLTSGGTLIAKSNITLGDESAAGGPNGESQGSIVFGAGNDFRITTSAGSGVIKQHTAAKPLYLQPADSNSILITKKATPANKIAEFIEGGAVNLYNDTALKFSTNSAGIIITGTDTTAIGDQNVARNSGTVQAGIFKFDTGSDGSSGDSNNARIQTTWLGDVATGLAAGTAMDFVIEDNAIDQFRWRKTGGSQLNNNNYYDDMSLKSTAGAEVTLKVGGGFQRSLGIDVVGIVDADTFTGQAASVASINAFDTNDLSEGTGANPNLYHTTARAQNAISLASPAAASGGGSLTYSSGVFTFAPANLSSFLTSVPAATSSVTGGIKTGFSTSAANRNYAVTLSSGKAYVNVPWVDTDTNTQRAITGSPSSTSSDEVSVSAKWAYTNVKKAVPSDAVFINTTYSADGNYGMALNSTTIRLKDDRRRQTNEARVQTGNLQEYITFNNDINGTTSGSGGVLQFYTDGYEEMRLESNGDLHVDGDITAFSTTISDERLKKNIKVVDGALDKVSKLNGVTFDWKRDNIASAGLIAQDIEKVLPSAIKEKQLPFKSDDEEFYKTVEYSQVTALLVEAIKELKEQNELMKAEIEELKANK